MRDVPFREPLKSTLAEAGATELLDLATDSSPGPWLLPPGPWGRHRAARPGHRQLTRAVAAPARPVGAPPSCSTWPPAACSTSRCSRTRSSWATSCWWSSRWPWTGPGFSQAAVDPLRTPRHPLPGPRRAGRSVLEDAPPRPEHRRPGGRRGFPPDQTLIRRARPPTHRHHRRRGFPPDQTLIRRARPPTHRHHRRRRGFPPDLTLILLSACLPPAVTKWSARLPIFGV